MEKTNKKGDKVVDFDFEQSHQMGYKSCTYKPTHKNLMRKSFHQKTKYRALIHGRTICTKKQSVTREE